VVAGKTSRNLGPINLTEELALPLFMARIGADNVHAPFATDNFAVFADTFNTGADFHRSLLTKFRLSKARQYRNQPLVTTRPIFQQIAFFSCAEATPSGISPDAKADCLAGLAAAAVSSCNGG